MNKGGNLAVEAQPNCREKGTHFARMFVYYSPPRSLCGFKDPALSVMHELDGGKTVEHVPGRTRGGDSARKTGGALIRQGEHINELI